MEHLLSSQPLPLAGQSATFDRSLADARNRSMSVPGCCPINVKAYSNSLFGRDRAVVTDSAGRLA